MVVLDGRPAGERVTLTEVRTRTPRHASSPRVAEVLADLGLLDDDTTPAIRQWIHRRASELPAGFAEPVRAWLGVLLDDLDLPNRRITIAGHTQRLGELTDRALRAWLQQRCTAWPHTPNRHVLISEKTALGGAPISKGYFHYHLRGHDVDLDRIRKDRILHEALTVGPDPLHLSLVFNLSLTTAGRYAAIAEHLLDGRLEQPPNGSSS